MEQASRDIGLYGSHFVLMTWRPLSHTTCRWR